MAGRPFANHGDEWTWESGASEAVYNRAVFFFCPGEDLSVDWTHSWLNVSPAIGLISVMLFLN